jgi:glycosyltransferase involved in cell wall biosynthesis
MRVALYTRTFSPAIGGMERFAHNLANWLVEHDHEVVIITHTTLDGGFRRDVGFRVLRGGSNRSIFRALRWADAVHVNGLSARGVSMALEAGHRPVVTHQGHQAICPTGLAWSLDGGCSAGPVPGPCSVCPRQKARGKVDVSAHRLISMVARRNVCVSTYLQRRLGLRKSVAIYNPVSGDAFEYADATSAQDGLVSFAGRLVAEKGLDILLRAMTSLPDSRLEIAGDGPMRQAWERLTEHLGIKSRVRFLGQLATERVRQLHLRARVVCVPTICNEAFGYAAAEAMALGKPVVATPRGALPELLVGGRGLVAEGVGPEALTAALKVALADDRLRVWTGARARSFAATELSIDALAPRYVKIYEEAGI